MKKNSIIFALSILVACVAPSPQEDTRMECQQVMAAYTLILNRDDNGEIEKYNMMLSEDFQSATPSCGFWYNAKNQKLDVLVLSKKPLMLMLQLPFTDNNWQLEVLELNEYGFEGIFWWESWGARRKVGTFNAQRNPVHDKTAQLNAKTNSQYFFGALALTISFNTDKA